MKKIILAAMFALGMTASVEAHVLSGGATYYGGEKKHNFCGGKTASGQRFNCGAMTAAHKTLPFGTVLGVRTPSGSCTVTINDRGPFRRGYFLDFSPTAASACGGRHTHHNVTASIISMGSGGTIHSGRRGRRVIEAPVVAPAFTPLPFFNIFQPQQPAVVIKRRRR